MLASSPRVQHVLAGLTEARDMLIVPRPSQFERDITKIPTKKVWVSFAQANDCKPGTVTSGFKYGQVCA